VLLYTLSMVLYDPLSLMLICISHARNQAESPLLRLPREIRNMIIEYALSETDGLRYRFPEEGSHRLYPKSYLYSGQMYPRSAFEGSQLKYICRQLRHEIKGLAIIFNDLTFTHTKVDHPHPIGKVQPFCSRLSERSLQFLRVININSHPDFGRQTKAKKLSRSATRHRINDHRLCSAIYRKTVDLCKFVRLHPYVQSNLDITLTPHGCKHNVPYTHWLLDEILLRLIVFRGHIKAMHRLGFVLDIELHWAMREARLLSDGKGGVVLDAHNVRFCVPEDWFNEEGIRLDCKWNSGKLEWVESDFSSGFDAFVKWIETWCKAYFLTLVFTLHS
jgi:hypothetical protein